MADYKDIHKALAVLESIGQKTPESEAYNNALATIKTLCAETLSEYKEHWRKTGTPRINEHIDASKAYWMISYDSYSEAETRIYANYRAMLRIDYPKDSIAPPYVVTEIKLDPVADLIPLGAQHSPIPFPCPKNGVRMSEQYVIH